MIRVFLALPVLALLSGCLGELPLEDYPCLIAQDEYDTYNEAYVFAPGGNKEPVIERAQLAEKNCNEKMQNSS